VLHTLSISPSLTWSFWLYLARSTSYEGPHYAIFCNLLLCHPSSLQIFPSPLCIRCNHAWGNYVYYSVLNAVKHTA
jgi:hypothetical protein